MNVVQAALMRMVRAEHILDCGGILDFGSERLWTGAVSQTINCTPLPVIAAMIVATVTATIVTANAAFLLGLCTCG